MLRGAGGPEVWARNTDERLLRRPSTSPPTSRRRDRSVRHTRVRLVNIWWERSIIPGAQQLLDHTDVCGRRTRRRLSLGHGSRDGFRPATVVFVLVYRTAAIRNDGVTSAAADEPIKLWSPDRFSFPCVSKCSPLRTSESAVLTVKNRETKRAREKEGWEWKRVTNRRRYRIFVSLPYTKREQKIPSRRAVFGTTRLNSLLQQPSLTPGI